MMLVEGVHPCYCVRYREPSDLDTEALSSQEDINGEKLTDERVKETPEQGSGDKCFLKSPTSLFQL